MFERVKEDFVAHLRANRVTKKGNPFSNKEIYDASIHALDKLVDNISPSVGGEYRDRVLAAMKMHSSITFSLHYDLSSGIYIKTFDNFYKTAFHRVKAMVNDAQLARLKATNSPRLASASRNLDARLAEFDRRLAANVGKPVKPELIAKLKDEVLIHCVQPFTERKVWQAYVNVLERFRDSFVSLAAKER